MKVQIIKPQTQKLNCPWTSVKSEEALHLLHARERHAGDGELVDLLPRDREDVRDEFLPEDEQAAPLAPQLFVSSGRGGNPA